MRGTIAFALTVALACASPAAAQVKGAECFTSTDPGVLISECTIAIKSGALSGANLAQSYDNRARGWEETGETDKALADYAEALKFNDRFGPVFHDRGRLHLKAGDLDAALNDFSAGIAAAPSSLLYTDRADIWFRRKDFAAAIADYSKAIDLDPHGDAKLYNNRGVCYVYAGLGIDPAIDDFTKAIAIDPNYAEAYRNRGNAWIMKHDIDRGNADLAIAKQLEQ